MFAQSCDLRKRFPSESHLASFPLGEFQHLRRMNRTQPSGEFYSGDVSLPTLEPKTPAEPMPPPIQEPPSPMENPDAPVREPDPEEPEQI
jgi:hypothetical protein